MPFQVSRSAWSVIGWVTISPPKINSIISKILAPNFRKFQNIPKIPKFPKFPKNSKISKISEISKNFQNLQKLQNFQISKKLALMFWKNPVHTRSGDFGDFGNFGIFQILKFLEILEIFEILDFLEILEFLEWIFRRADCDPSDDRPCTTTHLQRQGLSILMSIFRRISICVYIYIYMY